MPYVTSTKSIDDMPIYPGVVGSFVPGQPVFVSDSVRHIYVGNPDFTITDGYPAIGDVRVTVISATAPIDADGRPDGTIVFYPAA
jgi:hypothetical protein